MTAFLRYNPEIQALVGMSLKDGHKHIKKLQKDNPQLELRVAIEDGKYLILTQDLHINRINVCIKGGIITEIHSQG